MPISTDGHCAICTACRAPLRLMMISHSPVRLYHDALHVEDIAVEHVECENCGASLGQFEDVQAKYKGVISR